MVGDINEDKGKAAKSVRTADGRGWESTTKEFVKGSGCRRVILDRVMDGRLDRGSVKTKSNRVTCVRGVG
jgi:hypothetical protein